VICLTAVREDPGTEGQPQDASLRRQMAQELASGEAQDYAVAARALAKVIVNPQALD
jgi:type III secretory pathway component EscU